MNDIPSLWLKHREAGWPHGVGPNEGELMTLDTVISGCATYYLESEDGLDSQRVDILEDCMADLDGLMTDLADETIEYFARLQTIGRLLLEAHHR
jgi:hypothetical protein